jgi:DNA-binding NtrC family response regulator
MKTNLIVIDDDSEFKREPFFVEVAEAFPGIVIFFFENPEEAIPCINSKLEAAEKVIVLLDLGFANDTLQGTEILKIIRQKSYLIPVIILTAADDDLKVAEELVNYKATAFMRKTFSLLDKMSILRNIVDYLNLDLPGAIEEWIETNPNERRNIQYIATSNGKSYTLNEILSEIRRETSIGKDFANKLIKLTVDLVSRSKEKLDG